MVILIYCAFKTVLDLPVLLAAAWVLVFVYAIEISQYFHLIDILGLQNSALARILLGTTFSFTDMLMYTLGIIVVLAFERFKTSLTKY